jgi:hypothetical protein
MGREWAALAMALLALLAERAAASVCSTGCDSGFYWAQANDSCIQCVAGA